MSIATEIARLQQAKADLKTSINAKGGTITDETIDEYASKVSALPSPKEEQTKTVSPTTSSQDVLPDSGKVLSKVTVNAIPTETKSQQPSLGSGNQTINATSGKFMTSFTITKDTINHIASNIRSGITLYGVTGNLQPAKEEETKTVTPNFASGNVVVTPTSGKVMSQVTINKDSNLIAGNIKKDVTVHGITGTLESGGGVSLTNLPFFEYTVGTGTNNKVMYLLVSAMGHDGRNEYSSGITVKNSSDNAIFNIKAEYFGDLSISIDGGSSWTYLQTSFALIKLNLKDAIKQYLEYFNETPYPLTIYRYLDQFGEIDYAETPSSIVKVEPENGKYYFQEISLYPGSLYFLIVDLKSVTTD